MKCSGKCFCDKNCSINHEIKESKCYCNGIHKSCQKLCGYCLQNKCVYINNHKTQYGGCACLSCDRENMFKKI